MPVFENLKVGWWYAIFEIAEEPPSDNPFMWSGPKTRIYNGLPHKIIAVSYPFVFCRGVNGASSTFDTRSVKLSSLTDSFVRAWKRDFESFQETGQPAPPKKKRRKKEKPDPRACLRCGGRIVERMTRVSDGWRHVCRDCGFDCGGVLK